MSQKNIADSIQFAECHVKRKAGGYSKIFSGQIK